MKKSLLILFTLVLINTNIQALDLMFGINITNKAIEISDKTTEEKKIAEMDDGISYSPTIALRTEPNYFGNSNWGYFFELNGMMFDIEKQLVNEDKKDIGTSIKGYSLYVVPTAYYHLKLDNDKDGWGLKTGIGIGAGYLNMSGDFIITKQSHQNYGETQKVDISKFGMAIGIFSELAYRNHSFIIQNYMPDISDDKYEYYAHNVNIMYRYKITIPIP